MPCNHRHNPHGSASTYGLQVITMSGGTTITIGDSAGKIEMTATPTAASVRRFCFTCHASSDTGAGWTGTATSVVGATDRVAGIPRLTASAGVLRLPAVSGHRNADTQRDTCHGSDYSTADSNNVHNPAGGISNGGSACYTCHSSYRVMEMSDSGRTNTYHHVMGSAATSGDLAPGTGGYPMSTVEVYCVSCHSDHNYFNGSTPTSPAANLRIDIADSNGANATNTDFIASGTYGICLSCHDTSALAKDNANQKNDGRANVAEIAGVDYSGSSHNYNATSQFGSSTFRSNCSKCHNDEQTKAYQTGVYQFGTHFSAERNLLSALGGTLVVALDEAECYRCHSGGAAGNDYYGVKAMSQLAKRTQTQFAKASKHPVVVNAGGGSLACVSCHNVHEESPANKVSDPDNTYNSINYPTTVDEKTTYCLRCHDATPPSAWSALAPILS